MRLLRSLPHAALPALLLLLPCTATARAALALDLEHLKLADGRTISGNATEYDDALKVVSFTTSDGQKLLLRLDELDPRSAYMLAKSRVDTTSASSELRMANFARDIGLYAHASRHYKEALKLDPAMTADIEKEQARNRTLAAAWCMANAKKSADAGNLADAERWLRAILERLPNEPEAKQATELLDEYYTKSRAAKDDHIEAKDATLLTTKLKRGKDSYDRMVARNKEGLLASPASSKAISAWESAVKDGERALAELDKFAKTNQDPATAELLESYRKVVNEQIIEVYTNMASAQTTRSSFQQAMGSVNKALAIDPQSQSAIAMRSRVEQASAQSGGRVWW